MENKFSKARKRTASVLDLALDYNEQDSVLQGFSKLACLISGAQYSQINLLDSENQWTVAQNGMKFDHIPIEMSICNITITKEDTYEIKDFLEDPDFKNHPLVVNSPFLRYYIGFPFSDENGAIIGTICLLHTEEIALSEIQYEMFSKIKQQISTYLIQKRKLHKAQDLITKKNNQMNQIRHDIRGPLSGIIGFSDLLEIESSDPDIIKKAKLIKKSSKTLLEYSENSLREDLEDTTESLPQTDIGTVVTKLKSLYAMQSVLKNVRLDFEVLTPKNATISQIATNDAINIIGNVLSNAIKFSDKDSSVQVIFSESKEHIEIVVADEGKGIESSVLSKLNSLEYIKDYAISSSTTGFGIGLMEALNVLVEKNGDFHIDSSLGKGTQVALLFPKNSTPMD
ncbi:MAG: GAF domain-containing sensor histidine kinase [Balneola sp.]